MEDSVKQLIKVARRMLCYVPRAYDSEGPRGELEMAIKDVEGLLSPKTNLEDEAK